MERRGISSTDSSSFICQRTNWRINTMSRKCLWDKSHPSFKKHKHPCRFLCEQCNKEIYSKYRGLFTPTQFKDNIDLIKEQRKRTSEREWNLGEAWVVEKLGLDTLVKLDLFENGLV